ncbi:MAG: dockerin type I domain-containing protein [Clostridium sp.]|nr:dockerin type I domain-containing protein [Clostridium sp.]MCM1547372.1 dockerin type I domain-containing protein [Ruminococcus sp.]
MRKFTKEISALIASAAIGTAVGVGAYSASSEEIVQTAGEQMVPDETVCATEVQIIPSEVPTETLFPPTAGVPLAPDELIDPTEPEFPPMAGDPLPPDELIDPTEPEFPPMAGDPLPPDELIESTLPPLAGDIAPADGDINGDGSFNVADVVLLRKRLLNLPDSDFDNWRAADFYADGKLDVLDLTLMKRALLNTMPAAENDNDEQ